MEVFAGLGRDDPARIAINLLCKAEADAATPEQRERAGLVLAFAGDAPDKVAASVTAALGDADPGVRMQTARCSRRHRARHSLREGAVSESGSAGLKSILPVKLTSTIATTSRSIASALGAKLDGGVGERLLGGDLVVVVVAAIALAAGVVALRRARGADGAVRRKRRSASFVLFLDSV